MMLSVILSKDILYCMTIYICTYTLGVCNCWTGFFTATWDWNMGLECGTGLWNWNVGLDCGTGMWD